MTEKEVVANLEMARAAMLLSPEKRISALCALINLNHAETLMPGTVIAYITGLECALSTHPSVAQSGVEIDTVKKPRKDKL